MLDFLARMDGKTMRTVVLTLVACLLTACGSDGDAVELDESGHVVRQCSAMAGLFDVRMSNVKGVAGCSPDALQTGLGFGTYAKPGEITYSADGCQVTARIEWRGNVYTYDLQVEPDGSTARGQGTLTSGTQCAMTFNAELVAL